jgi:ankyrin repeat protein
MIKRISVERELASAAREKRWELICGGIEHNKIDINHRFYEGNTLLHLLCLESKNIQCLVWLLQRPGLHLDLENEHGYMPLAVAIRFAGVKTVELLIEHGASLKLNSDAVSPVAYALLSKHPERDAMLNLLLAQPQLATNLETVRSKININEQFADGRTLLHYAVYYQKDQLLIWLLEQANLKINLADKFDRTALFDAIRHKRPAEIMQHLIDRGADYNYRNRYGITPLYWACMHSSQAIIACLLQQPKLVVLESLRQAMQDNCLEHKDSLLTLLQQAGHQEAVDWLQQLVEGQGLTTKTAAAYIISDAEITSGLKLFNTYLEDDDIPGAKQYYNVQLRLFRHWPTARAAEFLPVIYKLAERTVDVLELKIYLEDTIQNIMEFIPTSQRLNFYLEFAKLLLQHNETELRIYCYISALNNSVFGSAAYNKIQNCLENIEIKARYQYAAVVIKTSLTSLQNDYAAVYQLWQQIQPLLAAERHICSEPSLFSDFSKLLEEYGADYLYDIDAANNTPAHLETRAKNLLQMADSLDNSCKEIGLKWLNQLLSSSTTWSQELTSDCARISVKFYGAAPSSRSISPPASSQLAIGVNCQQQVKVLRADFAAGLSRENIIERQQAYTIGIVQLVKSIAQQVTTWLGDAPCAYALLGFGSISRQSLATYSDIDCAILIADLAYKSHPYFSSLVLSIDAVLQAMAEPCAYINKTVVRQGLHLDNLAKITCSERQQLLVNTPAGLAKFVASSVASTDSTEQGFAFALLNPCLLYASSGSNLLFSYRSLLAAVLNHNEQLPLFWQLVKNTFKPQLSQTVNIKEVYLNPLLYLINLATLAYRITDATGGLEARLKTVLEQLDEYWQVDYLTQIKADLEYLCLLRAQQHFRHQRQVDLIEPQHVASLMPWYGLAELGYEFTARAKFNPASMYAELFNKLLDSKPDPEQLGKQLSLAAPILVQLARAELYPIYLRLTNNSRESLIKAMQARAHPEINWYQALPDLRGISLNKQQNLQVWQNTLLQLTEEYRPGKKLEYVAQGRVILEWLVEQDGQVVKITRLLPSNYRQAAKDYPYCNSEGTFNCQQLARHGLLVGSTKRQVINLQTAYLKLYFR